MNGRKLNANTILKMLIEQILINLDELFENKTPSEFNVGGRYAYLDCLEIISVWRNFNEYGIDNIEKKYPLK